jgi:hypothetical protein
MSGQSGSATGTGQKKGKELKQFPNQQQWEEAVNQVMATICNERLSNVPASFDTKGRYQRGDDPATTARAAYDAIDNDN